MDSKTTTLLLRSQAHGYVAAATLTCHLYEQIATFSDEVDLIWRRKAGWNIPKVLFVITRYMGLCNQIYCFYAFAISGHSLYSVKSFIHFLPADRGGKSELFFDAETYIAVIPFVSMHGIMVCRILCMYHHSRKIVVFLATSCVLEMIILFVVKIIYDVSANNVPDPIPGIHICITSPGYNYLYAETIPIIALELTLLCLTISRGFHFYQAQRRISWSFRGRRSLASILFRDSIMIPFVTLVILFACLVLLLRAPFGPIFQIVYLICVFWPGIAGPRLILNLRQAYYAPFKDECHRADLDTEDSDCL